MWLRTRYNQRCNWSESQECERECEAITGYHGFMEPNFIIPEDYYSSFNKLQTNPITLEKLKQQAGKMIFNQYDLVISSGGKKNTQER